MNRRGFIGALIAALALFRPRPICVECGSRDHVTSTCYAKMGPYWIDVYAPMRGHNSIYVEVSENPEAIVINMGELFRGDGS